MGFEPEPSPEPWPEPSASGWKAMRLPLPAFISIASSDAFVSRDPPLAAPVPCTKHGSLRAGKADCFQGKAG